MDLGMWSVGGGMSKTNFLQILRETCIYKAVQSSCPESRFIYSAIMVSLVKETFKVLLRQLGWWALTGDWYQVSGAQKR